MPTPRQLRVLVVDDEEFVRGAIEALLQHFGHHVIGTSDPEEALRIFAERPSSFDLVTVDHVMPSMTGLVLARRLRELLPHLSVIMISAFCSDISDAELAAAGIRATVKKPFRADDLSAAIEQALKTDS